MRFRILTFIFFFFSFIPVSIAQREPYSFLSVIQAGLPNPSDYPESLIKGGGIVGNHQRDLIKFESAIPLLQFYSNRLIASRLPSGYAVIPIVESNNSPKALSRVGAVGVWQLMPDTAKKYGLIVDFYEDERYLISQSTSAAVSHLAYLTKLFDHPVYVLAAYNWGERNVINFIKKNPNSNPNLLLASPQLPAETKSYIQRIYGIWYALSDLGAGHPLHFYPNVNYFSLEMSSDFIASKRSAIQIFLNPVNTYNRERLVPTDYFYSFFRDIPGLNAPNISKISTRCSNQLISNYNLYVVAPGDSHERIIKKFNVTDPVKKNFIYEINLHPGLVIKVPVADSVASYPKEAC
jgi:Transglycosylase SLT domain